MIHQLSHSCIKKSLLKDNATVNQTSTTENHESQPTFQLSTIQKCHIRNVTNEALEQSYDLGEVSSQLRKESEDNSDLTEGQIAAPQLVKLRSAGRGLTLPFHRNEDGPVWEPKLYS